MRLVHDVDSELTRGARSLITLTREPSAEGLVTHVKLRALVAEVNFDALLSEIRALDHGGGGRGRAAGLFSSSGRVVSPTELDRHLAWLIPRLERL